MLLPLSTSFTSRFVVSLFCLVQSFTSVNIWNPDHAVLWSEYASNDDCDRKMVAALEGSGDNHKDRINRSGCDTRDILDPDSVPPLR